MKKTLLLTATLFAALALSACGLREAPPAMYQPPQAAVVAIPTAAASPAPAIVNAAAPAHSGASDILFGGAVGYMLASAGNSRGSGVDTSHTTINKTVVNKTAVVQQAALPPKSTLLTASTSPPSYRPINTYAKSTTTPAYSATTSSSRPVTSYTKTMYVIARR